MTTANTYVQCESEWFAVEIEAGRVCGDHERPQPCIECQS